MFLLYTSILSFIKIIFTYLHGVTSLWRVDDLRNVRRTYGERRDAPVEGDIKITQAKTKRDSRSQNRESHSDMSDFLKLESLTFNILTFYKIKPNINLTASQ